MHQAACFQELTAENQPMDSAEVLLLLKVPVNNKYTAVIASPRFQKLLSGEQLTHFQLDNDSLLEVQDYKIVGWCPINFNPPKS